MDRRPLQLAEAHLRQPPRGAEEGHDIADADSLRRTPVDERQRPLEEGGGRRRPACRFTLDHPLRSAPDDAGPMGRPLREDPLQLLLFADWGKDPYYTEHNFGLLDYDFNPKPAYFAVAFMTRLLGDMEPDGELGETPANFRVARFAKFRDAERKKAVLAAWSVYGEGVRWKLPDEYALPAKVYDLMGNECSAEVLDCGDIILSEAPVYLVFERSAIAR